MQEIVCHKSEGAYAYLLDPSKLSITLKARKGYLKSSSLLYGDPWEHAAPFNKLRMERIASDDLFDYFNVALEVPKSRRLCYFFALDDGHRKLWYTEIGFHAKQPKTKEMGHPFFQFLYIRENDTFLTPDWAKEAVFYQIFPERFRNGDRANDPPNTVEWGTLPATNEICYGGDLRGITDSLPYLSNLGIDAIYLTPIFSSSTSHKYDTDDYYRIDPHFGDLETFCEMVEKSHKMGIKVVLDGAFDHCGYEFWAFQDVVQKGPRSKYVDWFKIYSYPIRTHPIATYETWGKNIWRMPRFMTSHPGVKKYLIDVAVHWTKQADVDGWRLDTASEVDHEFWRDFRKAIKTAKPDALIIGEIAQNAAPWLQGDQFDSVMNYPLRDIIVEFFAKGSIKAEEFDARLARLRMQYCEQANMVLYNMLGSHDTVRFLTLCDGHVEKMKCAIIFQMTYVGMPAVYYGDEIGLGGDKRWEDSRLGMVWDRKKQNRDLLDFYKKLIGIRKRNQALTKGNFVTVHANSKMNTYAYLRSLGKSQLLVILNNSSQKRNITVENRKINLDAHSAFTDLLGGGKYKATKGKIKVSLKAYGGVILKSAK